MSEDEVVPPSDSEEAEEWKAEEDGYWDEAATAMRGDDPVSDSEVSYVQNVSPPRKRRKLSHSVENTPLRRRHSADSLRPVQSSPIQARSPRRSLSPRKALTQSKLALTTRPSLSTISNHGTTNFQRGLPTPSPPSSLFELPIVATSPPRSSSVGDLSEHLSSPGGIDEGEPRVSSSRSSPFSLSQHPANPAVLFSTPPRSNPKRVRSPDHMVEDSLDRDLFSSPLTPPTPSQPIRAPPSPSPDQRDSDIARGEVSSNRVPHRQAEDAQWAGHRLRDRTFAQKRPYMTESMRYQRQMEHFPEAIVRQAALSGRRDKRSPGQADSSDQEYEESQMADTTQDQSGDPSPVRAASPEPGPSHVAPPNRVEEWYKQHLHELDDDDDDDEPLFDPRLKKSKVTNEVSREPPRPKSFPMKMRKQKAVQKAVVTRSLSTDPHKPHEANTPLAPRVLSRSFSRRKVVHSDDEEEPVALGPSGTLSRSTSRDLSGLSRDATPTDAYDLPPPIVHPLLMSHDDAERRPHTSPSLFEQELDHDFDNGHQDIGFTDDGELPLSLRRDAHDLGSHWPRGDPGKQVHGASRTNRISVDDEADEASDTSEGSGEVESDSEPKLFEGSHKPNKLMRILRRMGPAVYVNKLLGNGAAGSSKTQPRKETRDGPLQAGEVRTHKRRTPVRDDEIRGDEESPDEGNGDEAQDEDPNKDDDTDDNGNRTATPPLRSAVVVRKHVRPFTRAPPPTVINLVELSDSEESESDSADDEVYDGVDSTVKARLVNEGISLRDEGIDFLLNRTGARKSSKRKKRKQGTHAARPARPSSSRQPRLGPTVTRVVARGVRSVGHERQTLLPVRRMREVAAGKPRHAPERDDGDDASDSAEAFETSLPQRGSQGDYSIDVTISSVAQKKKRRKEKRQDDLWTFDGGRRLVSGRTHAGGYTVQAEEDFSGPSTSKRRAFDPRSPQPAPRKRQKTRTISAPMNNTTLENFEGFETHSLSAPAERYVSPVPRPEVLQKLWPTDEEILDCDLPKPESGTSFGEASELSKQRLERLLRPILDEDPPAAFLGHVMVNSSMPLASFVDVLKGMLSELAGSLSEDGASIVADEYADRRRALWYIGPHVSRFRQRASVDGVSALESALDAILKETHNLVEGFYAVRSDDGFANMLVLDIQWFVIEMAYRVRPACGIDLKSKLATDVGTHLKLLVRHILAFDLEREPFDACSPSSRPPADQRAAELWIFLIHLIQHWPEAQAAGSLWDVVHQAVTEREVDIYRPKDSWFLASERTWTTIFTLCALSTFSSTGVATSKSRLPPAWKFVKFALDRVKLQTPPKEIPKSRRENFDNYLRLLIGRCLFLHQTWSWGWDWTGSMPEALLLFQRLVQIFQSRHFAGLTNEKVDYPVFLRLNNLERLEEQAGNGYTLLLKLMVAAYKDAPSSCAKRLLSVSRPLGGLSYAASHTKYDYLSGLCNRFAAIAVSIYLDPGSAKDAVSKARRYVDLTEMPHMACRVYIRGAMYIGMLLREKGYPLQGIVDCLTDVVRELVDRFKKGRFNEKLRDGVELDDAGNNLVLGILMVLRALCRMLIDPRSKGASNELSGRPWDGTMYPDPALLAPSCIEMICDDEAALTRSKTIRSELQRLVLAFVDVRDRLHPSRFSDNEESQGLYDDELDWDAGEVLAAGGEDDKIHLRRSREEETAARLIKPVIPTFYRLLIAAIDEADPRLPSKDVKSYGWLECWTACASAVVRSQKKDWPWFLGLVPFDWPGRSVSLRRRLWLRFRYHTAKYDPTAYEKNCLPYLQSLMHCLVIPGMAMAGTYVSLILWVDGLQHPMLKNVPFDISDSKGPSEVSTEEFDLKRPLILKAVLNNIVSTINDQDQTVTVVAFALLETLLSTMKDNFPDIVESKKDEFRALCQEVSDILLHCAALPSTPIIDPLMTWLRDTFPIVTNP